MTPDKINEAVELANKKVANQKSYYGVRTPPDDFIIAQALLSICKEIEDAPVVYKVVQRNEDDPEEKWDAWLDTKIPHDSTHKARLLRVEKL